MPSIVLATLNARYAHASRGLRCLRANMGELLDDTVIREFVIRTPPEQIVADLAKDSEAGAFDDLVIVAPPVALGEMRKATVCAEALYDPGNQRLTT